jgi:glucokinase
MNILAGDIGGTKTILATFSSGAGMRQPVVERSYPSQQHESLETIIASFLQETRLPVDLACFGVAGPVVAGSARITNLPWVIDSSQLKTFLGFDTVRLLNDLESVAWAVPTFQPDDIHTLNPGMPVRDGSIAILAPGTGLGEGFLTWQQGVYQPHASEGSHASFAPDNPLQMGLLTYLHDKGYEHVSFERVCSGGLGIPNLYSYLKTTGLQEPAWLAEELASCDDPTPLIFSAARDASRKCELAQATVDLFVSILGSEAGNLALKVMATGGIYLGGGIPPRILPELQKPAFLEALRSKGRFRTMLADIPVHAILNPRSGLLGAAACGFSISPSG